MIILTQASNIVSVTNTFAGRAPVALAPDDSVLVCCNRSTAMDIQVGWRQRFLATWKLEL